MADNKIVMFVVALALTFACGSGIAFGQANDSGFRGAKGWHLASNRHEAQPPADPSDPNPDCTLIVPKAPLTAAGLATPYQMTATDPNQGPCNEANSAQSAFVQAAVFDPATGNISVYSPLVIDKGTQPAVPPVVPTLPPHAVVAIWFGYNATNLTLAPSSPGDLLFAQCVNGLPGSVFSQFAYCNAPAFFKAANQAITSGLLKVPALGTAADGLPCPTVRDFYVVDQDQSDNLPTLYLIATNGEIAQRTQKNLAALSGATPLGNPSDNRLTDAFLDVALSCQPFTAPDLADPGQMVPALPLNELQARMDQPTPVALVPGGDPMAEESTHEDLLKVNLYRVGVDQPVADSVADADTSRYCRQMLRIAPSRMFLDQGLLTGIASPDPGAANNLFTFMAQRFVASYQILNCASLIQLADPITVTTDSNGVATNATLGTLLYNQEIQDIAGQKSADDAADRSALSLLSVE